VDVNRKRGTPLRFCINCSDTLIAATSSKYVSEQSIRNSWSCDACGFEFRTASSALLSTKLVKSRSDARC
jgi:RNase P subunit RPR2